MEREWQAGVFHLVRFTMAPEDFLTSSAVVKASDWWTPDQVATLIEDDQRRYGEPPRGDGDVVAPRDRQPRVGQSVGAVLGEPRLDDSEKVEWVGLLGVLAPPVKRSRLVSDDSEGHQDAILARVGPFVCQLLTGETCDPFVGLVLGHFGFADEIDVPAFAPK